MNEIPWKLVERRLKRFELLAYFGPNKQSARSPHPHKQTHKLKQAKREKRRMATGTEHPFPREKVEEEEASLPAQPPQPPTTPTSTASKKRKRRVRYKRNKSKATVAAGKEDEQREGEEEPPLPAGGGEEGEEELELEPREEGKERWRKGKRPVAATSLSDTVVGGLGLGNKRERELKEEEVVVVEGPVEETPEPEPVVAEQTAAAEEEEIESPEIVVDVTAPVQEEKTFTPAHSQTLIISPSVEDEGEVKGKDKEEEGLPLPSPKPSVFLFQKTPTTTPPPEEEEKGVLGQTEMKEEESFQLQPPKPTEEDLGVTEDSQVEEKPSTVTPKPSVFLMLDETVDSSFTPPNEPQDEPISNDENPVEVDGAGAVLVESSLSETEAAGGVEAGFVRNFVRALELEQKHSTSELELRSRSKDAVRKESPVAVSVPETGKSDPCLFGREEFRAGWEKGQERALEAEDKPAPFPTLLSSDFTHLEVFTKEIPPPLPQAPPPAAVGATSSSPTPSLLLVEEEKSNGNLDEGDCGLDVTGSVTCFQPTLEELDRIQLIQEDKKGKKGMKGSSQGNVVRGKEMAESSEDEAGGCCLNLRRSRSKKSSSKPRSKGIPLRKRLSNAIFPNRD